MKTFFESKHATINFNGATKTIELIWEDVVTEEIYRETFTKGLELLIETKATSWISDIHKQGVIGTESSQWLQKNIIPKALSNGLEKIAIIMDKDIFKKFYIDNVKQSVQEKSLMQYFDSMESAYTWIKEG